MARDPNSQVFDQAAVNFTRDTDTKLRQGYRRAEVMMDMVKRTVPPRAEILDYGCGPGRLSLLLAQAGYRVHGMDISEGMISEAKKLDTKSLDVRFDLLEDGTAALPAEKYDAVVCLSVIEYVVDPDALLRTFHKALRKRGVLVLSYANISSRWRRRFNVQKDRSKTLMYLPHNHAWNWSGFRTILERNGFSRELGPTYFESQDDWRAIGRALSRLPWFGTLGMIAARAV